MGTFPYNPIGPMTLLVTLALPLGNGYTSKVYTTSWTYSVGTKKNSKLFLPNKYTPLMTMARVYTLGPTKSSKYVRQTDHPHFMGDICNVHDLWLTYGTYASNGRCTECSHFMVDIQDMSAPQKTVRTSKTDKAQTTTT